VAAIKKYCSFIAPVSAYPGEFEQEALASGALRILRGEEKAQKYTGKPAWNGFKF
jgi:butyrate kinase